MIGLGRLYSLIFDNVSIAAAQDFFYIKPAADKICVVEAIYLSNVGGTADAGDAQEELLRVAINRLPTVVTAGTGGAASTATTLGPVEVNDSAPSFTGRTNDATTVASTTGTIRTIHADGWNVRVPYVWFPPPEHRIMVSNPEALVFRLLSTPADAVLCSGTIYVRELP
jgi:hypothetical protein